MLGLTRWRGEYLGGLEGVNPSKSQLMLSAQKGVQLVAGFHTHTFPWEEVVSVSTEEPDQERWQRVTVTRLLFTGPFAVFWKKQETGKTHAIVSVELTGERLFAFLIDQKHLKPYKVEAEVAKWNLACKGRQEAGAVGAAT